MLKLLSLSLVAAVAAANVASAQVEAPREVNQEQGRGAQEREVDNRAGVPNRDRTGVTNGARRQNRIENRQERALQNAPGQGTTIITNRPVNEAGTAANDQHMKLDHHLADCLLLHNQEEINLARFALEKSQNPKVKEFAQMLIDDHQKFAEKLAPFSQHRQSETDRQQTGQIREEIRTAPQQTRVLPREDRRLENEAQQNAQNLPQPAATVERDPQAGRTEVQVGFRGNNNVGHEMFQIEKQAVQKCEEMTKNMLSKESGAQFDQCFVGLQIGMHIGTLAHLNAAEEHVSGDFKQVLHEGATTVQKHYDQAMALRTELSKEAK